MMVVEFLFDLIKTFSIDIHVRIEVTSGDRLDVIWVKIPPVHRTIQRLRFDDKLVVRKDGCEQHVNWSILLELGAGYKVLPVFDAPSESVRDSGMIGGKFECHCN